MPDYCAQCEYASYRGLSPAGFKFLIKEKRIKCRGYPNPENREIYVKNPLLKDTPCRLFKPVSDAEYKQRLNSLTKFGVKI
jgi:hypothetical protein